MVTQMAQKHKADASEQLRFTPEKCKKDPDHHVIFFGFRDNFHERKQRYYCAECSQGRSFVKKDESFHRKFPRHIIIFSKEQHAEGHNCAEISRMIKEKFRIYVSRCTVWLWITGEKYPKKPPTKKENIDREEARLETRIPLGQEGELVDTEPNPQE
jgi:hypothetical protein